MRTSSGVEVLVPRGQLTGAARAATLAALNHPHSRSTTADDAVRRSRAAAAIASTSSAGENWPQPYPGPYQDFSRLLQSTDQLAQQLQSASARLSHLTEVAGGRSTT